MPSADDFQPYVEVTELIEINDIATVKLKYHLGTIRGKVIGFYEMEPIFERTDLDGKCVPYPRIKPDDYESYQKIEKQNGI